MTTEDFENNADPAEEEESTKVLSFAELLDEYEYKMPERGQIIRGKILRVEDNAVFIDVGAKRDAIVPNSDLSLLDQELLESLERGMELPVYVLTSPVGDEELLVSINKGLEQEDWERAERLMETEEAIELEIVGYNKGGLIVQFGQLQGFVPNSHVPDLRYGGGQLQAESRKARRVGETLLLKVLEVDQLRRRLILSAKAAHKEQRRRTLELLEKGSVVEGRIANIVKYGAFVDIGSGVSGLLHVSEIAWHRVDDPAEVLTVGDRIEVEIQDVDPDRERISLSRKAVLPNPWDTVEQRYKSGDLVQGRVTNIEDFGAFVEVDEGVVGLVHVSEIDVFGPAKISDIVHEGDTLLVRVLDIDPKEERLSLSMRRVKPEEQIAWMQRQREQAETEAGVELEDDEAVTGGEDALPVDSAAEAEEAQAVAVVELEDVETGADDEAALPEAPGAVETSEDDGAPAVETA
jgi:small subunit ribosomal protein S1